MPFVLVLCMFFGMQVLFVWFRYFCLNWLGSRLVLIGLGCRCRLVVIFFIFFYIFLVLNDCCLSVFCYPSGFLLFASVFFLFVNVFWGEEHGEMIVLVNVFGVILYCFLVDIILGGFWLILFMVDMVYG